MVGEYYSTYGSRSYEDRIYQNLGEFYFDKLRYNDAAASRTTRSSSAIRTTARRPSSACA